jgi:hypothetical protein
MRLLLQLRAQLTPAARLQPFTVRWQWPAWPRAVNGGDVLPLATGGLLLLFVFVLLLNLLAAGG